MKKRTYIPIYLLFIIGLISFQGIANARTIISTESIISNEIDVKITVTFSEKPEGELAYDISLSSYPKFINTTTSFNFKIIAINTTHEDSPNDIYLNMVHSNGYLIETGSEITFFGATNGIKIPPVGPGNNVVITETGGIDMPYAGYNFSKGEHIFKISLNPGDISTDDLAKINLIFNTTEEANLVSAPQKYSNNHTLIVYPNPFYSEVRFKYIKSPEKTGAKAWLVIYDQRGTVYDRREFTLNESGEIKYQNNALNVGKYFYKLTLENKVQTGILIKK